MNDIVKLPRKDTPPVWQITEYFSNLVTPGTVSRRIVVTRYPLKMMVIWSQYMRCIFRPFYWPCIVIIKVLERHLDSCVRQNKTPVINRGKKLFWIVRVESFPGVSGRQMAKALYTRCTSSPGHTSATLCPIYHLYLYIQRA